MVYLLYLGKPASALHKRVNSWTQRQKFEFDRVHSGFDWERLEEACGVCIESYSTVTVVGPLD